MKIFKDINGNNIRISFSLNAFDLAAKHVWVICQYNNQWVLTKHKKRGLEFPGGKQEKGETLEEAAVREVLEETGGIIDSLQFIAQYEVKGMNEHFVKNVYYAKLKGFRNQDHFYETDGPVLLKSSLKKDELNENFSFIMKDDVLQICLGYLREAGVIE